MVKETVSDLVDVSTEIQYTAPNNSLEEAMYVSAPSYCTSATM